MKNGLRFGAVAFLFFLVLCVAACSGGGSGSDDDNSSSDDDTAAGDDTAGDDTSVDDDIVPTTLDVALVPTKNADTGQWELDPGPGDARVDRNDLSVQPTRDPAGAGRLSLAYFMVVSDSHITDEESPTRLTFFDSSLILDGLFESAYRPQEDLAAHLLDALIRTADRIQSDYGRDFDFAASLGDNTDNGQTNEMETFIDVFDGGGLTGAKFGYVRVDSGEVDIDPATGLDRGERNFGVQETDADGNNIDHFNRPGLPNSNADVPAQGLTASSGALLPWFTVIGNHDVLNTGNFEPSSALTFYTPADYLSDRAPFGFIPGLGATITDWRANPDTPIHIDGGFFRLNVEWGIVFNLLTSLGMIPDDISLDIDPRFALATLQNHTPDITSDDGVTIAPDADRAYMGRDALIKLVSGAGHGFADNNNDGVVDARDGGWYRVDWDQIHAGQNMPLRFLVLDSTEQGILADGGLGNDQLAWIQTELDQAAADSVLVVLMSHHQEGSISNGAQLGDMLASSPYVFLHIVGHGHDNSITPHQGTGGAGGYWEVETSSTLEFPQQSRIEEIVDNRDGTGSIYLTLFDFSSVAGDDTDALAGQGRKEALGDKVRLGYDGGVLRGQGTPTDRNVNLLFAIPDDVASRLDQIQSDGVVTSTDVLGTLYQGK